MKTNTDIENGVVSGFLDMTDDLFWKVDHTGQIVQAVNWRLYFETDICGQPLLDLVQQSPNSSQDWDLFLQSWTAGTDSPKRRLQLKATNKTVDVECHFKQRTTASGPQEIIGVFRNITEQVTVEQQLTLAGNRFDQVLANAPILISITDVVTNRYVDVNEAFCEFHQKTRDQFIGQKSLGFFVDQQPGFYQGLIDQLLAGEEVPQQDITLKRGDGAIRTISALLVILEYADGPKLLVFSTDITDRLELEKSAQITEAILMAMNQGVTLFDEHFQLVFCNDHFKNLLNVPEWLCVPGTRFEDMVRYLAARGEYGPGEVEQLVKERFEFINRDYVYSAQRVQGSGRVLDIEGTPVSNIGLLSIYKDITERVESETNIRENERLLREVLATLPFSYTLWDSEGNRILGNDLMYEWFKKDVPNYKELMHSLPKLIGEMIDNDLIHPKPQDKENYIQTQLQLLNNPPTDVAVLRHIGDKRMQVINKKLPSGYIASIRVDVTEQLLQEEQLRQAQKMEAVGQLTGGIAHDFNNILSIMMGNMDILAELNLFEGELAASRFKAIMRAGEKGADLTQQLLSFSRKQQLRPTNLNLNDAILEMNMLLKSTLGGSVELELDLADHLWECLIDQGQLENSLINLCINARDAMRATGTLSIKTTNVTLDDQLFEYDSEKVSGEFVKLVFCDTGIGISEDHLKQIFEPFFTTKEVGKGSGLGLSMVFGFVSQTGGYIDVISEVGVGTTFEIYLPRH